MDGVIRSIKYAVAAIGAVLTAFLGGWDMVLRVLVLFVALDYITGVAAAWAEKQLSSEIGARGILKKVLLFVIVALAYQLDKAIGQEVFRSLAIWFYMANEALSIIENCGRAGVPIPAFLRTALEQLKKKTDEGTTNATT
jgi:toxin secretion/phage lysis holin